LGKPERLLVVDPPAGRSPAPLVRSVRAARTGVV